MGGGGRGPRISYAASRIDNEGRPFSQSIDLNRYANNGKPKVFISFHVEDEDQVNLLRQQAKDSRYNIEFADYSVKEPFDEKWKTQCTERLKMCSVVVVMIGPETYSRPAVVWEVGKAYELGKPVIGVRIYRDENHRIPEPMAKNNATIINWDLDQLNNQIHDAG